MSNEKLSKLQKRTASQCQATRPTAVCTAIQHPAPTPPTSLKPIELPVAGALGSEALVSPKSLLQSKTVGTRPVLEQSLAQTVHPVRTTVFSSFAGIRALTPDMKAYDLAVKQKPEMELRVRAIYAVDKDVKPLWTLDHVRAAVAALVEAANRDLEGTGFRFVTFPRHDVEIRNDTELRKDVVLSDDIFAALISGAINMAQGENIIKAGQEAVRNHRNRVAAERPNTLLWIFSRGNSFKKYKGNSLQSLNYPDYYVRHENYLSFIATITSDSSPLAKSDATWNIKPGLANAQATSFESKNYPGHYLRHQNYRLKLSKSDNTDLFKKDATFWPRDGLGDNSAKSFESFNYPDHFIRHRNYELWLDRFTNDDLFKKDATFKIVAPFNDDFSSWEYADDRGGSFSGVDCDFVALHEAFFNSIEGAREDASRAVHETGHYLGLAHTHREPFHEFSRTIPPEVLDDPSPVRLAAWKKAVATWLDAELPDDATAFQAKEKYDADRPYGVLDTPADPGAGIMALANDAAGYGWDELGPITSISVDVPGITDPVTFTPLRDNLMGYYLRETPEAMRFTDDQVEVMRNLLINGGRRPLVAAQLGDTATPKLRVCAVWSPSSKPQRLTWGWKLDDHAAEHSRMRQAGMVMIHQQAYTLNGTVLFDGIWNPGNRSQEIIWSWLDEHVRDDLPKRAARGMFPVVVQGYQHLDHGIRYNVLYESGTGDARVLLGATQDELVNAWEDWMSKGYRMTCLSSHVDASGILRYSTVLRPKGTPQSWVAGWTLEDIAQEYGRRWNDGWRIRYITVARVADGHRWSAVFEPDEQNQLVYWAHVRERITEVYDEMWAVDFKLRSMYAVPA